MEPIEEYIITPNYVDLRTKYARQNLGLTNEKVHPYENYEQTS
jgi:hypothetical protein